MLALATHIAPSASSLFMAVAWYGASNPFKILLAAVVSPPYTKKLSLAIKGTPASLPTLSPLFTLLSISSALFKALFSRVEIIALYSCFSFIILNDFLTRLSAVTLPDETSWTISAIGFHELSAILI